MEEQQFLFSVEENQSDDFQEEESQEVGFINFQPVTKKLEIKPTLVTGVVKIRNREQAIKYVKVAAEKVLETLNQEEQAKAASDPDYKAVKITKLDVGTVSIIIRRALNIIIKDGNIAYFSEFGYYVIDYNNAFLKTLIMVAEQSLTIKDVETVIFKIKYGVYRHVNALSGLSHDFEEKFTDKKRFVVVGNGIFDKQEHKLLAHNPQCIRFVGVPTNYTEFETPPSIDGWDVDNWFAELMSHDEEKISLLWQVISATLSNYSYRKSVWFLGEGLDGKSTITQLITNLIKNVGMLKVNQFSERFALANLVGKLACIGEDVQANVYLDDNSNFNSVVTGDSVLIDVKNKSSYMTRLEMTVIQTTNSLPKLKAKGKGVNRRFLILPFSHSFEEEEDKWYIKSDYIYRKEILEYVLFKAINLNFDRFIEPKASTEALEDFKSGNNTIFKFVNELLENGKSERYPLIFLWEAYKLWCREEEVKALNKFDFTKSLKTVLPQNWGWKKGKILQDKFEVDFETNRYKLDGMDVFPNISKIVGCYQNVHSGIFKETEEEKQIREVLG